MREREREIGNVGGKCGRTETEVDVDVARPPGTRAMETERELGKKAGGDGGGGDRVRGERRWRLGKREIEAESLNSVCPLPQSMTS